MAEIKFDDATFTAMKDVEKVVVRALLPLRENIEAGLIILALIRCARVLLRLYPKKVQGELLPVLIAYLRGDTKQPSGDPASLLWTPQSRN